MTLFLLAYGAGLLSTVNPCGFALLPGFLGFYLGDQHEGDESSGARKLLRGFGTGGALSLGFAGTFVVVGLILAAGLRAIVGVIPWTAVVIGFALTMAGLAMLSGRRFGLPLPAGFAGGQSRSPVRVVLFGAAYAVASLSCTVAVFLALIGQALSAGSVPQLVGVFVAYGLGAATILVSLSVSAALARAAIARYLRPLLPIVGRIGGAVLTLTGLYLVAYWLPVVLHPGSLAPQGIAGISENLSAALTGFLADHEFVVALLGAALLLIAVTMLARARARPHVPR